jgi:uncharacterized protein
MGGHVMDFLHPLSGFLVGVLVGITGVGGGSLMAPIMILLLGVAPTTAVGTDLWFAAITKMFGGAVHQKHGSADWQVVRRLAMGSLPAAGATLYFVSELNMSQVKTGIVVQMLGVVLILTAVATLMRKQIHAQARAARIETKTTFKKWQPGLTVFCGAILGVLVTLTSVGAGALGATMLLALYPLRLSARRIVGTDIIHAVPLTILAGLGYLWMGKVDLGLLGSLLIGSVPGIVIGSIAASRVSENVIRPALAAVLTFAGVKLLGLIG